MLLPAPVELACADGETGPLCNRDAGARRARRASTARRRRSSRPGCCFLCGEHATAARDAVTTCDRRITRADDDPRRGRPHAPARRVDQARAQPRDVRERGAARHPALGLPLAERVRAAGARSGREPATWSASRAGTTSSKRGGRSAEAALRPLGRGDDRRDVPRAAPGDARAKRRRARPRACGARSSYARISGCSTRRTTASIISGVGAALFADVRCAASAGSSRRRLCRIRRLSGLAARSSTLLGHRAT